MKIIRSLYKWVLHWANTPRGLVALFFLAFAESSFFPIPPDVLLIALCLGRPKRALFYALICTSASVLGGMFGYLIGHEFWHLSNDFFLRHIFSEATFFRVQELYQQNAFLSIFVSGFTPIPYKVFTITAGVFDIPFGTFTFASTLGRGLRFFPCRWSVNVFLEVK